MDDLEKQAEELGIKVDGRWSAERLKAEIDKALSGDDKEPEPAAEKLVKVRIERDYWDGEGTRHRAGTEVEVSVEAALDGIETGALSRVKG